MSRLTSRSTASLPLCMRPEALMRGPILKITSLMVISLPERPQVRMMARRPMLGLELMRFRPKCVSTRFSPVIGTMSAAIDTATRSSMLSRSDVERPLLTANPCISL